MPPGNVRLTDIWKLRPAPQVAQAQPAGVLNEFRKCGKNVGVALAGIRERVKELGRSLKIDSGASGTQIRAAIPLHQLLTRTMRN